MKTYTKAVSESTTVIGGIDKFGAKGDLLQVTEEFGAGQPLFRVYFLCDHIGGHPIKTFTNETEAIEDCKKHIRNLKMPISNVNMRMQEL